MSQDHNLSETKCEWARSGPASPRASVRNRVAAEAGLSLIELMIAMTLLLVVMGATYGIWSGLNRTYAFTEDDLRAQEQARSAMGEMVELIRTARKPTSPPSETLNAVIVKAEPNELEFWADVDKDAAHTVELHPFRVDTSRPPPVSRPGGGERRLHRRHVRAAGDHQRLQRHGAPLFSYRDGARAT